MAKASGDQDMPDFKVGDKVRANGREATLVGYDTEANRLAYVVIERQGHDNTFYDHISSTNLELIESAPEDQDETDVVDEDHDDELEGGEATASFEPESAGPRELNSNDDQPEPDDEPSFGPEDAGPAENNSNEDAGAAEAAAARAADGDSSKGGPVSPYDRNDKDEYSE